MRARVGALLLFAGLLALALFDVLGPGSLFVSWGFALAGLLVLRRHASLRRAAHAGLVALAASVAIGALLAGLTIGARGRVLASTPTLDPAFGAAAIGFVAAWVATAVFLVVHERAHGRRLAVASLALMAQGAILFVGMQMRRLALGDGAVLTLTLGGGALLLLVSLGRFTWRAQPNAA